MAKIQMEGFRCERCAHEWAPRNTSALPRVCPACKSPYWNTPKKKPLMPDQQSNIRQSESLSSGRHGPSTHEREIALLEYAAIIDNKSTQDRERKERLAQWHRKYKGWFKNEPIGHGQPIS